MNDRGREDRSTLPPGPAIEQPRNRRQDHVAPIRETHVGNVRKAKNNRSRPPPRQIALARLREHVLQYPTEKKLLGPRREQKDRDGKKRYGLPFTPLRSELDKMYPLG